HLESRVLVRRAGSTARARRLSGAARAACAELGAGEAHGVVGCGLSRRIRRRVSFSKRGSAAPGLLKGHTAIQTLQPNVSLKNGTHLSKSTYHFSTPRTSCLVSDMAFVGHARVQI